MPDSIVLCSLPVPCFLGREVIYNVDEQSLVFDLRYSEDSANTLTVMDEVRENVAVQQEKMVETMDKFNAVRQGIVASNESTEQIHKQASDCDTARVAVVDIIQNLSALSEENAASTQETTASMEELNATINVLADDANSLKEVAASLEKEMRFFTV